MSSRFNTLLLREWMQHKRGWLITLLLPPLLFLAILPFGNVEGMPLDHPLPMALLIVMISSAAVFGISYASAMFQLSGLARRDNQDRSIEFWLSLPASHSESIGATVLTHTVLVPLAALVVGFGFSALIAPGVIAKQGGMAALASVPWSSVMVAAVPLLLRALLGVVLMSLWLAPLMLMLMAASAWLKRWGLPALALTLGVGGVILDKVYGLRIVWDLLDAQIKGASLALFADPSGLPAQLRDARLGSDEKLDTAAWALHDGLSALQALASPHLLGGLLVAAGCFALLVLKRSRSN